MEQAAPEDDGGGGLDDAQTEKEDPNAGAADKVPVGVDVKVIED